MKKLSVVIVLTCCLQLGEAIGKMSAYFSFCAFNRPQDIPFIETYLTVIGNSVVFSPNLNNNYQSAIEVQWVLKQEEKIVFFDKYNLLSPELESAQAFKPNFMDQQRIPAPNGKYILELSISDKNSPDSKFTTSQEIEINFPADQISISDIELLESFAPAGEQSKMAKSGYDFVPYISDFFPESMERIRFYCEIYNSKVLLGDEDFLVRYAIFNDNNKQIVNDIVASKRMKATDVGVIIGDLPLSDVPSGNYSLALEIRDKTNEVRARKSVFFQRSNKRMIKEIPPTDDFSAFEISGTFVAPISDRDTLKDYIASLTPISGKTDRQIANNQLSIGDVQSMQQYFYYFWLRQDRLNPERKWMAYKTEVDKVNASYGTRIRRGYDTDRGRVYLQYGPPNSIEQVENDPNTYPYEIWHYYSIGSQTNRKFVFYSRDRSSNDYVLLHSDVTGEPSAYDWQLKLHEKITQYGNDLDADKAPSSFGDRSEELFRNPR